MSHKADHENPDYCWPTDFYPEESECYDPAFYCSNYPDDPSCEQVESTPEVGVPVPDVNLPHTGPTSPLLAAVIAMAVAYRMMPRRNR